MDTITMNTDGKEIISIPCSDVVNQLCCEIELTGIKTFKLRFAIGVLIFKLAAWVVGMKGTVTVGDTTLGEIV
jgi:hypothetical protein